MSNNYAENHDLEKLIRWRNDLSKEPANHFPVHAVFLVSSKDRLAHDVFRSFRSSFQSLNTGFRHLTIFGQHGLSSTARRLLREFGLTDDDYPTLVLLVGAESESVFSLPLPAGGSPLDLDYNDAQPWQLVLAAVEAAANEEDSILELSSISKVVGPTKTEEPLKRLVDRLLGEV